ncbi:MAG: magnesium transporter [Nanoarchaeota archaeon]|nr:magnesium transporter [Nanoarchaeota archaeon]
MIFDKSFKEIFSAQLFAIVGGIIAGIVLATYREMIFLIPGMLIVIPGFMAMRGNISGTFASRISSGLFLGVIDPNKPDPKIIRGNLTGSFILAIVVSLALGIIASIFNYIIMGVFVYQIVLIPLFAGILSNFILNPMTLFATMYLFKKGHDPNNIIGPVVTTLGDVTSIISLLLVIIIIT